MVDEADVGLIPTGFEPAWKDCLLRLLIERIDYDSQNGTISINFHPGDIKALGDHKFTKNAV